MATTQQGACTNSVYPNDNLSQSVQPIQQVGNLTYHQLQPMQYIQSAHAPMQTHMQHQPQNVQSNTPQVTPQWVSDIVTQLKNMNQKLDTIDTTLSSMKREIKGLSNRVVEVEKSQEFISKSLEDNEKNTSKALTELSDLKMALDQSLQENVRITESVLDMQCRSMRDNLLFFGIEEAQSGEQENCEDIITSLCASKLEIRSEILIERAHRLGSKKNNKPHPIVVKFNRFPHREMVRKCSYKLKDTHISIGEQFPKEIQERRKKLLPIYKRAKENNQKAVLARDKLFIDGKLYSDDGPVQMKATPTQPKASGRRGQKHGRGK